MTNLTRPDGRTYRPRKPGLRVRAWENYGTANEESAGVIVFGTLDPDEAQPFAQKSAEYWYGDADSFHLAGSVSGWWRDGFRDGERAWVEDGKRGAPGVMFTWAERDLAGRGTSR